MVAVCHLRLAADRRLVVLAAPATAKQSGRSANQLNQRPQQWLGQEATLQQDVVNGLSRVKLGDSVWPVRCPPPPARRQPGTSSAPPRHHVDRRAAATLNHPLWSRLHLLYCPPTPPPSQGAVSGACIPANRHNQVRYYYQGHLAKTQAMEIPHSGRLPWTTSLATQLTPCSSSTRAKPPALLYWPHAPHPPPASRLGLPL